MKLKVKSFVYFFDRAKCKLKFPFPYDFVLRLNRGSSSVTKLLKLFLCKNLAIGKPQYICHSSPTILLGDEKFFVANEIKMKQRRISLYKMSCSVL